MPKQAQVTLEANGAGVKITLSSWTTFAPERTLSPGEIELLTDWLLCHQTQSTHCAARLEL